MSKIVMKHRNLYVQSLLCKQVKNSIKNATDDHIQFIRDSLGSTGIGWI